MELLEIQLTTPEGQVAVFHMNNNADISAQLHIIASAGLFSVSVRIYGSVVWSEIDPCDCGDCADTPLEQRPNRI